MGFSYVAAVAILLSSSLIFFGMVYGEFVQSNSQVSSAQNKMNQENYDLLNSKVNITGYYVVPGTTYNITINMTNTGSITLNLDTSSLLVNGTIVNAVPSSNYLFPLGNGSITFHSTSAGIKAVELIFNTGYEKFTKVNV
ncbi:MAG: hypothetical protein B2I17_07405 [Thermoplasmatales archaeon B_DKE]|nr:MAG: hypothetical protein B2I17_07405 [Thermoplasmatales archaeon B_DKE]